MRCDADDDYGIEPIYSSTKSIALGLRISAG